MNRFTSENQIDSLLQPSRELILKCPPAHAALFGLACTERLMGCYKGFSYIDKSAQPDKLRGIVDKLWQADQSGSSDNLDLAKVIEEVEGLYPSPDDYDNFLGFPAAKCVENTLNVLGFLADGSSSEILSCIDNIVEATQEYLLQINSPFRHYYSFDDEVYAAFLAWIFQSPIFQSQIQFFEAAIARIRRIDTDPNDTDAVLDLKKLASDSGIMPMLLGFTSNSSFHW